MITKSFQQDIVRFVIPSWHRQTREIYVALSLILRRISERAS
jgi:hypothetical protein